jgi:hypothetical protein
MKKLQIFALLFMLNLISHASIKNVPSAYSTIQSALNACQLGDTVLVNSGIYYENIIWPNIANIKLFSNGDSSNTIIDGSNLNSVIIFDSVNTIDTFTVIKGFKIRNGNLTGVNSFGGGIFINKCSPKFIEVNITQNNISGSSLAYGAGVYAYESDALFLNSSISFNKILYGTWAYGGGIYIEKGSLKLVNTVFNNNNINSYSWGYGGGIYCIKSNSNFNYCNVNDNLIFASSWAFGGGLYLADSSFTLIQNTIINNNKLKSLSWSMGNGIAVFLSNVEVTNTEITNNKSDSLGSWHYGGGINLTYSSCKLTNVLIAKNSLGKDANWIFGGGIAFINFSSLGFDTIDLMNATITDNKKTDSTLFYAGSVYCSFCEKIYFKAKNSIFYNQSAALEFITDTLQLDISYSNINGGYIGLGNINLPPGFVSLTDFHLTANSPCLNSGNVAGSPAFDLDNNPRPIPINTNPDIGCYEFQLNSKVESLYNQKQVIIYPNPNNGQFILEIDHDAIVTISDAIGRTFYNKQLSSGKNTLLLNHASTGIYFIKIETHNLNYNKSIFINN